MTITDRITPEAAQALIEAIEPLDGLGYGAFDCMGLFCAVGALRHRDTTGETAVSLGLAAGDPGACGYHYSGALYLTTAGATVIDENDRLGDEETPAERKTRMLAWLRGIAEGGEG